MIETARYDTTQPLRVQHVANERHAPFYANRVQWQYAGVLEPWPVLTDAGRYDAAPLAPTELFGAGGRVESFGVFGISVDGASGLRLYADRPISALGGCRIAVAADADDEALLHVILAYRYNVWPVAFGAPHTSHNALLSRETVPGARYVYDLGDEWAAWQNLPLVEAVWAIRSDAPALARGVINYLLGDSIQKAQPQTHTRHYRLTGSDHDSLAVLRRLWLNLPAQGAAATPIPQRIAA